MFKSLVVILFLSSTLSVSGHEYFFGYAEVEYNDFSKTLETTIVVTAHDLESALKQDGLTKTLDEIDSTQANYRLIEEYLNKHFEVKGTNESCHFKLIGIEVSLNGMASFYLESNEVTLNDELNARFDLLMDEFKEQQNKLTFYYQNKSKTITFLQHKKEQEFELSKI